MDASVPPDTSPESPSAEQSDTIVRSDKAALSRDLSDFLIELSIGIHKHAMYPADHPSLRPAANSVTEKLTGLLDERATLSIGVARDQLVIEGFATDQSHAVLRDLASRLHSHHLGAISFASGVTGFEVEQFLKLVAIDANRSGEPLGLGPASRRQEQPHIRLYPVAYDRLELADEELGAEDRKAREAKTRAAQLWVGLARAALALEQIENDDELTDAEPSLVARAISQHERGSAYDQVIVGYLLQIADEVKTAGGSDALALKNRITKLVSHLEQHTLRHLLEMGGDRKQRIRFLLDANQAMSIDAVVKLVTAAAQTEGQTISDSYLRILMKLRDHAERGSAGRRGPADQFVRDQIGELVRDWTLKDPNPDEYTLALQQMAASDPMFRVSSERIYKPEPERIVQMAIEVNTSGPTVTAAVNSLVKSHQIKWLVDTVNDAKSAAVKGAIWRDLATTARLAEILKTEPLDVEGLDGLLPRLGAEGAEPMLEALMESESRQARRVLLDRIVRLGHAVAPLAVARLADSRWYVQRNMLAIIAELPELPEGFRPQDFFDHPDERVRREALRLMFNHPEHRERAICRALADGDGRTIRLGLTAAQDDCPKAAISLVVSRATSSGSDELRVSAIRVLGTIKERAGLDVLLKLTRPRRSFLGTRLPAKTPEYLAALRALQRHREKPEVARVLAAAARSRDEEVAAAATRRRASGMHND